ncbi:hypothetical protein AKUA1404_14060 [Apilactobacillus kunkeei]|uniref:DUF805 domain-containing protein n=1 Tax=Apilactobacillus nanyangensis TaxID=2799579 RepID=A0ABT0HVZ7_9LACO|nr:DUF805 domain-containing protein [Apilactobacillus nanyangensis]MCK8610904.1 DUF805 domain-containing protein [Apilactobacillus nanyangensis]CAI2696252.1 hypothetical protein AKUA1404_14060 [Apilactobacillus kunkeei]
MFKAYKLFWKNYFNFTGVSTRSEYWWVFLINSIIYAVFALAFGGVTIVTAYATGHADKTFGIAALIGIAVCILYTIATVIPTISLHFRRYRDAGVTPWFLLITYGVPFVLKGSNVYDKHVLVQTLVLIISIIGFIILVMPSKDRK